MEEILLNNEIRGISKEVAVTQFKVMSQNLPGRAE
jgi:hypothetical protein